MLSIENGICSWFSNDDHNDSFFRVTLIGGILKWSYRFVSQRARHSSYLVYCFV